MMVLVLVYVGWSLIVILLGCIGFGSMVVFMRNWLMLVVVVWFLVMV